VLRGGPGNFPGATTFVEGRAASAGVADVQLDEAVLPLTGGVVVRQRELLAAEDEDLHGGVRGALGGDLVVPHDGIHHRVAGHRHLLGGEVVGALDVAGAHADARLGRHVLEEVDAGDGLLLRPALLHDLGHGDLELRERLGLVVVGGDLLSERGRRGAACGHASHLPFGRSLGRDQHS